MDFAKCDAGYGVLPSRILFPAHDIRETLRKGAKQPPLA